MSQNCSGLNGEHKKLAHLLTLKNFPPHDLASLSQLCLPHLVKWHFHSHSYSCNNPIFFNNTTFSSSTVSSLATKKYIFQLANTQLVQALTSIRSLQKLPDWTLDFFLDFLTLLLYSEIVPKWNAVPINLMFCITHGLLQQGNPTSSPVCSLSTSQPISHPQLLSQDFYTWNFLSPVVLFPENT